MASDAQKRAAQSAEGGYQPKPGGAEQKGYQPQTAESIDPLKLQPPKGDTAIQPPKSPSSENSE